MTPEKTIECVRETISQLEGVTATLSMLPENIGVYFADHIAIHLSKTTYAANMAALHDIRKVLGRVDLSSYYVGCDGTLALSYSTDHADIVMYCTDIENALNRVSNGKCTLVEKARNDIRLDVVCQNGGES